MSFTRRSQRVTLAKLWELISPTVNGLWLSWPSLPMLRRRQDSRLTFPTKLSHPIPLNRLPSANGGNNRHRLSGLAQSSEIIRIHRSQIALRGCTTLGWSRRRKEIPWRIICVVTLQCPGPTAVALRWPRSRLVEMSEFLRLWLLHHSS